MTKAAIGSGHYFPADRLISNLHRAGGCSGQPPGQSQTWDSTFGSDALIDGWLPRPKLASPGGEAASMGHGITDLPFEEWIYFIFDHPSEGPEWHVDPAAPYWV